MNEDRQVYYSIGVNPWSKSKKCRYVLWRQFGSVQEMIARFRDNDAVLKFARDFNFPLRDDQVIDLHNEKDKK